MKGKADRKRSWLMLAVLGGLVIGYGYFFYFPGSRKMAEMKDALAEAEFEAEGTVGLLAALDSTQKQLDAATAYTEAWKAAAPSEHDISEVFERIHKLTRLAETETIRFEPQSAVEYETFRRVPVSMECEGSFAQLSSVLTALEKMREPVWLRAVEFQSSGKDEEKVIVEVSLDVFADNLEDSDQGKLSGRPITQEVDQIGTPL